MSERPLKLWRLSSFFNHLDFTPCYYFPDIATFHFSCRDSLCHDRPSDPLFLIISISGLATIFLTSPHSNFRAVIRCVTSAQRSLLFFNHLDFTPCYYFPDIGTTFLKKLECGDVRNIVLTDMNDRLLAKKAIKNTTFPPSCRTPFETPETLPRITDLFSS